MGNMITPNEMQAFKIGKTSRCKSANNKVFISRSVDSSVYRKIFHSHKGGSASKSPLVYLYYFKKGLINLRKRFVFADKESEKKLHSVQLLNFDLIEIVCG